MNIRGQMSPDVVVAIDNNIIEVKIQLIRGQGSYSMLLPEAASFLKSHKRLNNMRTPPKKQNNI